MLFVDDISKYKEIPVQGGKQRKGDIRTTVGNGTQQINRKNKQNVWHSYGKRANRCGFSLRSGNKEDRGIKYLGYLVQMLTHPLRGTRVGSTYIASTNEYQTLVV